MVHKAIFEILVEERGVLGFRQVHQGAQKQNHEAQVLSLLQESQQYNVISYGSSDEVEVLLVSREDWRKPNHLLTLQVGDTPTEQVVFPACSAPTNLLKGNKFGASRASLKTAGRSWRKRW